MAMITNTIYPQEKRLFRDHRGRQTRQLYAVGKNDAMDAMGQKPKTKKPWCDGCDGCDELKANSQ
jgi:hypothetical protein